MNSQQLYQINKKINQIKKNLQARQQKAQQWSIPYEKVLYPHLNHRNNQRGPFNQEYPQNNSSLFRNKNKLNTRNSSSYQKQNQNILFSQRNQYNNNRLINEINKNKQQSLNRKLKMNTKRNSHEKNIEYDKSREQMRKKVKVSRKKIKQYYNQLKQLHQLKQRKTKLYIHKNKENQQKQQILNANINTDNFNKCKQKNNSKLMKNYQQDKYSSQYGLSNSGFGLSKNIFSSTGYNPTSGNIPNLTFHLNKLNNGQNIRTIKDRINPFNGCKVQSILQFFQQAKSKGKQNIVCQMLGIGLKYTPLSNLKKELKKQENDIKIQENQNDEIKKIVPLLSKISAYSHKLNGIELGQQSFRKDFAKNLSLQIGQKQNIYLNSSLIKQTVNSKIESPETNRKKYKFKKQNMTIFEKRLKKVLGQSDYINKIIQNQHFQNKMYQTMFSSFNNKLNFQNIIGNQRKLKTNRQTQN